MGGLLSSMQGFFIIGVVIAVGYVAARARVGGPQAEYALNMFSFFVARPCLMFDILADENINQIFHPSIIVAFLSAFAVSVLFLICNRLWFHLNTADSTIGVLNSMFLNSNNIGLPVATYILGNPALVAPILVMQQAIFTPIALLILDVSTAKKVTAKDVLTQPFKQPMLIGTLLGIIVSILNNQFGFSFVPDFVRAPIAMIGAAAVPMTLLAFGMSLHSTKPLQNRSNLPAVITVTVLKNIVMPLAAFLIAYFMMGFRGPVLYACVVLAALPTAQNVYNYASRYGVGMAFARDGILLSTLSSPIIIAIISIFLS